MTKTVRFLVKPSSTNVTVSMATATGHSPPTSYASSSPALQLINTTSDSAEFSITFACTACQYWGSDSLATYYTPSPSMLSLIRAEGALSTSQRKRQASSSGISFHGNNYGVYEVNLEDTNGVASKATDDSKYWKAHAILVSIGFVGIYAIGILFASILNKVHGRIKIHYAIQSLGSLLGIIGIAFGFKAAGGSFDNAHTKFGLFLFILIFTQAILGTIQHFLYIKNILLLPYFVVRIAHRTVGWFFICGVVINVGLGLELVGVSKGGCIAWYVTLLLAFVIYFAVATISRMMRTENVPRHASNDIEMKKSANTTMT